MLAQHRKADFLVKIPLIFTLLQSEDCVSKDMAFVGIKYFILNSSYIFNMKVTHFSLSFMPFRSILNGFRTKNPKRSKFKSNQTMEINYF